MVSFFLSKNLPPCQQSCRDDIRGFLLSMRKSSKLNKNKSLRRSALSFHSKQTYINKWRSLRYQCCFNFGNSLKLQTWGASLPSRLLSGFVKAGNNIWDQSDVQQSIAPQRHHNIIKFFSLIHNMNTCCCLLLAAVCMCCSPLCLWDCKCKWLHSTFLE